MIFVACILLIITAFFGSFILRAVLKNRPTPGPIVLVHGIVALFSLLALIAYTVGHFDVLLLSSIILFVLAAMGGITMLTIDMSGKPVPKVIAMLHPVVALSGFVVLVVYVYRTFLS